MKYILLTVLICITISTYGQSYSLTGDVFDDNGKPIPYSTSVLLNPNDSTLEFYAIADKQGRFVIKNIKKGQYLLQIAYLGHETVYRKMQIPNKKGENLGAFILKQYDQSIDEVKITGEHVPIRIKQDTIEYNASAFKTKPDAVVEDLLKKLPGIKVDRAGNIKAMGENVNNLLVDGKEFFGNDPKVASKNLPADAIDKVQLYDKKSDESEFTGIDDGSRDKTINLQLKDDKKNSFFGDITAGYGTDEHYKASAKAYRFNNKIQFATLGMINNINQFGFSFSDYLNFNGGIASLMNGGGSAKIEITDNNSFPVNFGQPVTGLFTSGAGGFNFSHSKNKTDRFFISYLANGSGKSLEQKTTGQYFTGNTSFFHSDSLLEKIKDEAHRVNLGWRNRIDSNQNLIVNGAFSLTKRNSNSEKFQSSSENDLLINTQDYYSNIGSERISGNVNGSYIKKLKGNRTLFKLNADVFFSKNLNDLNYDNTVNFYQDRTLINNNVFQNNRTDNLNYTFDLSMMQKTNNIFYLVPVISYGNNTETLDRTQGFLISDDIPSDSVQIDFKKQYQHLNPGISIKRNTKESKFSISLGAEFGQMSSTLYDDEQASNYWFFTPGLSYEYEYKTGRRISFSYNSGTDIPTADQLLPLVNNLNPLSVFYGNPDLNPEYSHRANMHWWIFDQFSFTSLLTSLRARYTKNKINWSTTINDQLVQSHTLVNVDNDLMISGNIDFSTPIRKLGLKINFNIEESYNEGLNFVNSIENKIINHGTRSSFSAENRKKDKIEVISGVGVNIQNVKYSLQGSLNRQYFDLYWFGEIHYSPIDKFDFGITADITRYTDHAFSESVQIPLINAEINWRFFKNNRAQLSLNAFDILNQNTGIRRISELNYLREIRSNTLGRYVMLSFKYRINKFENRGNGIDIEINNRR